MRHACPNRLTFRSDCSTMLAHKDSHCDTCQCCQEHVKSYAVVPEAPKLAGAVTLVLICASDPEQVFGGLSE